jgi:hypothetical protein
LKRSHPALLYKSFLPWRPFCPFWSCSITDTVKVINDSAWDQTKTWCRDYGAWMGVDLSVNHQSFFLGDEREVPSVSSYLYTARDIVHGVTSLLWAISTIQGEREKNKAPTIAWSTQCQVGGYMSSQVQQSNPQTFQCHPFSTLLIPLTQPRFR